MELRVREEVRRLLPTVDMATASLRSVLASLEAELGPQARSWRYVVSEEIDLFIGRQVGEEEERRAEEGDGSGRGGAEGDPGTAGAAAASSPGPVSAAPDSSAPSASPATPPPSSSSPTLPPALSLASRLSATRFARPVRLRGGSAGVDLREWYADRDGEWRPGRRGILLTRAQWDVLAASRKEIERALERDDLPTMDGGEGGRTRGEGKEAKGAEKEGRRKRGKKAEDRLQGSSRPQSVDGSLQGSPQPQRVPAGSLQGSPAAAPPAPLFAKCAPPASAPLFAEVAPPASAPSPSAASPKDPVPITASKRRRAAGGGIWASPGDDSDDEGVAGAADADVGRRAAKRRGLDGEGGATAPSTAPSAAPFANPSASLSTACALILSANRRAEARSFRGRPLVDVRETYSKGGAVLPGRRGIALTPAQARKLAERRDAVDEALGRLEAKGGAKENEGGSSRRASSSADPTSPSSPPSIALDLGSSRLVTVSLFRNAPLVDVREHYTDKDGVERPGKKGISLPPAAWRTLANALAGLASAAERAAEEDKGRGKE